MLPGIDSQAKRGVSAMTGHEIDWVVPVLFLTPLVMSPFSTKLARR